MAAEKTKAADGKTQKAVVLCGPGEANLVTGRAFPTLRDDYIPVKTKAVALNPTDWKHIDFASNPGALSGCDYAGTVEEVGSKVNKPFKKGDRITGFVHGDLQIKIPDNFTFEQAATLGGGITSVGQGLYQSQMLAFPIQPVSIPSTIPIYGGSIASGTLAITLAKLSGYRVVTTCSPKHFEWVKQLGAAAAFDYRDLDTLEKIEEFTKDDVTMVWDTISTATSAQFCADTISSKTGGRYMSLLPLDRTSQVRRRSLTRSLEKRSWTAPTAIPGRAKDLEFGKMWWSVCEDLLRDGKVAPHRVRVEKGGLGGVIAGVDSLRKEEASVEKMVYRVDDGM